MIVILTQDLMMSSSANAVARAQGVVLKSVASLEKLLQLIADGEVTLVLVDLQMRGLQLAEFHESWQALDPVHRPRSVAYAQHVELELLKAARAMGFDEVLTRGQVSSGLPALFA